MKQKLLLSILALLTTVGAFALKGDVNGDGSVTAADITALYNWLLNNDSSNLVMATKTEMATSQQVMSQQYITSFSTVRKNPKNLWLHNIPLMATPSRWWRWREAPSAWAPPTKR